MNKTRQTNSKLREALGQAKEIARTIYSTSDKGSSHEDLSEKLVEIANAALAEPVRNYEVGAAREQTERFGEFCRRNYVGRECPTDCPLSCPLSSLEYLETECPLAWAQMPYEEGGEK